MTLPFRAVDLKLLKGPRLQNKTKTSLATNWRSGCCCSAHSAVLVHSAISFGWLMLKRHPSTKKTKTRKKVSQPHWKSGARALGVRKKSRHSPRGSDTPRTRWTRAARRSGGRGRVRNPWPSSGPDANGRRGPLEPRALNPPSWGCSNPNWMYFSASFSGFLLVDTESAVFPGWLKLSESMRPPKPSSPIPCLPLWALLR